jgi:2-C-methyl-D-erythritol 4-phosphate cytidylyltransferase
MIFAAILAGGIGNRMGSSDKPKQYMLLGDKPIIIHTIEKFYINEKFKKIVVLCPKSWISHTTDLINKFIGKNNRISVINGGTVRNETIMNAINHIEENFEIDKESVIVTHDAVRPFLTHRIIEENILYAQKYGACDTIIPASDTIIKSDDYEFISSIPKREVMFQGQTPQSFKMLRLKELYNGLTDHEKEILTDAAKIFVIKGEKVHLVDGEINNIKITYPYDLKVANCMLNGE